MRTNGITVYARGAYEEEFIARRFFGRTSFVLNGPELIRHVLVDRHEAYGRTNVGIRILRPLVGAGLFLSEGNAWRHQRRALAPAFTPKTVSLLIPHMLSATEEITAELRTVAGAPVDRFATVQRLALEIAGRTMFEIDSAAPSCARSSSVMASVSPVRTCSTCSCRCDGRNHRLRHRVGHRVSSGRESAARPRYCSSRKETGCSLAS
jgi:cytochrome P450